MRLVWVMCWFWAAEENQRFLDRLEMDLDDWIAMETVEGRR